MELRLLDPARDARLFEEAFSWRERAPRWFREADAVFGERDPYLAAYDPAQGHYGVFDREGLAGVIALTVRGEGVYEADLSARGGADAEPLARAGFLLRERLFEAGASEIFAWVMRRNRGVRRVCAASGLYETGVTVIRGATHGRVIEWVRLACDRTTWAAGG